MSLPPDHQQPVSTSEDQLIEDVALWLVKMSSDDCTSEDRQAFEQWQQQDPKRIALTQELQHTLGYFSQLQSDATLSHKQVLEKAIQEQDQYRWLKYSVVLLLSTCILSIWLAWQILPINQWMADTQTDSDTWTAQTLSDHSDINISGKTAYDIHFDQKQRLIALYNGNILVDVAKDAARPFVIETKHARITALGTRFTVQHYADVTILTMLESKTRVQYGQNLQQNIDVNAGQQLIINHEGILSHTEVSPAVLDNAWQKRMLVVNNMPLDQVLGLLQNYQNRTLVYDAEKLHQIGVNATLPLDTSALNLLENSLPIQIQTTIFGRTKITYDPQKINP